jgi:8-oxo-dGTP pyrophosphatase MutT (NUDIX family)
MTVPARPAATLLVIRDGDDGIEVVMTTRAVAADFAANALVFPGGRVEPSDGTPEHAAIRETWEEAGLLIARPQNEGSLATNADLAPHRGRPYFDLLAAGFAPALDLLVPFAHWVTPEDLPKRFDTRFYLAPFDADQTLIADGGETRDARWISVREARAAAESGRHTIVFATRMNLAKLARSATVAEALAAARASPIVTVQPVLVETETGLRLRIPIEAGYGIADVPAEGIPRAAASIRPV